MASLSDRGTSRDSSQIDSPLLYSNFGEGSHVLVSSQVHRAHNANASLGHLVNRICAMAGLHFLAQVTGGQGYIGSHTVLRMLEEGFMVTVVRLGPHAPNLAASPTLSLSLSIGCRTSHVREIV